MWKDAVETVKKVYKVIKLLPKEEHYALADQLRRAVVSIPSNIAEGAGRNGESEFKNFLGIALGSAYEAETQLVVAVELGMIEKEEAQDALNALYDIEKQITLVIDKFKEGSAPRQGEERPDERK